MTTRTFSIARALPVTLLYIIIHLLLLFLVHSMFPKTEKTPFLWYQFAPPMDIPPAKPLFVQKEAPESVLFHKVMMDDVD